MDKFFEQICSYVFLIVTSLTNIGSLCSIIALLLTIYILIKLRGIHRHFLFQARFPTLSKKISNHRKSLSQSLNSYNDSKETILVELRQCEANLRSLKPKLKKGIKNSVIKIIQKINKARKVQSCPPKGEVRDIYLALVELEQELENLSEDIRWEQRK